MIYLGPGIPVYIIPGCLFLFASFLAAIGPTSKVLLTPVWGFFRCYITENLHIEVGYSTHLGDPEMICSRSAVLAILILTSIR
jgi:hypothetical protein